MKVDEWRVDLLTKLVWCRGFVTRQQHRFPLPGRLCAPRMKAVDGVTTLASQGTSETSLCTTYLEDSLLSGRKPAQL